MNEKIDITITTNPKSIIRTAIMTSEYYEFIGKEPSLKTLEKFIKINKKEFDEYNTNCIAKNYENEKIDYIVIVEYLDFANRYTNNEYYYLGGHIKMKIDDPITEKSINDATTKNNESIPEHMMEVASKVRSTRQLDNLRKILDVYYEKCLEEYYAPPHPSPPLATLSQSENQPKQNSSIFSWLICGDNNNNNNNTQSSDSVSRRGGEGYEKVAKNTIIGKTISTKLPVTV